MAIRRISFRVEGDEVAGNLHLPETGEPFAAVVVAGPMTSIKEQVTGQYAGTLSRKGYAALAIDHRHYGESAGAPRQYEHHGHKHADLVAALDFLQADAGIPAHRLGAVGVCLGCGYIAELASRDSRIEAIGMVAGYYRDVAAMREADAVGFDSRITEGRLAREHYERTGEVKTIPAAALEGDAAMKTPDTVDYYCRRAAVPNYTNRFAVMSREYFLPFDVQGFASGIGVPLAMVHSESALSPHWARKFYAAVPAVKTERWLASKGQTDFYDDPALIEPSVDVIDMHFRSVFAYPEF